MNAREYLLGGVSAIALGAAIVMAPAAAVAQSAAGTTVTQSGYKADAAAFVQMGANGRTSCSTSQETVANLTITILNLQPCVIS